MGILLFIDLFKEIAILVHMLMIRLMRTGRRNYPSYRVVVADKRRAAKSGAFLEVLGHKDFMTKKQAVNSERVKYWIEKGAQVSDTVHNLLVDEKVIEGAKRRIKIKTKGKPSSAKATEGMEVISETPVEAKAKVSEQKAEKVREEEKSQE